MEFSLKRWLTSGALVACGCVLALPVRAQSQDGGPGADAGAAAADDTIILIEEDEPQGPGSSPLPSGIPALPEIPTPPGFPVTLSIPEPPPLPLGELTLAFSPAEVSQPAPAGGRSLLGLRAQHITLTGTLGLRSSVRPLGSVLDDVSRSLAAAVAAVDVRPDMPLSAHVDLVARVRSAFGARLPPVQQFQPLDFLLPTRSAEAGARFSGVLEVGEAYATVKFSRFRVVVGRQLFGWSQALGSPVASMLNPADPRDGIALPDELTARSATLAAAAQGTLGPLGLQLVVLPFYAAPRTPLFAEDAEAPDPHEPVLSLLSSREQLRNADTSRALQAQVPFADVLMVGDFSPTVGGRAFFTLGPADVALVAVLGHDPTPQLTLSPRVAAALGAAADRPGGTRVADALAGACGGPACRALDGELVLRWRRAAVAQVEASGMVGPAVLRGGLHVSPALGPGLGRVIHVVTRDGRLASADAWSAGGSVALESGYSELVQGFLEAGYEVIGAVPAGARIARYEADDQARSWERWVHRPTLSTRLQGVVLDDITWRLRTTLAPWQRELWFAPRVGYRLSLNQEVTLGTELFLGWPGTRAHFLFPTSRAYLEWAYRF
ncbi:MAG: hypothetical protein HY904_02300 [Deltaproteobacteria bacterium]|nr:hypothetical protein [Deltaproteobacteria bacterium]